MGMTHSIVRFLDKGEKYQDFTEEFYDSKYEELDFGYKDKDLYQIFEGAGQINIGYGQWLARPKDIDKLIKDCRDINSEYLIPTLRRMKKEKDLYFYFDV